MSSYQKVQVINEKAVVSKPAESKSVPWKIWLILTISCYGVFCANAATSALVIAFPTLLEDLDMTLETMLWVLISTLLTMAAIVPIAGKMGDIFGQTVVYKLGLLSFVVGNLGGGFCVAKNKGYDMLACRVIIGFGAALVSTNSQAIITTAFATYNKVGLASGLFGLASAMGIVFGPLIGGGLSNDNWPWIYWYCVPLGGIFFVIAIPLISSEYNIKQKLPEGQQPPTVIEKFLKFDFIGAFFCMAGLVLILIALVQAMAPDPVLSQTGSLVGLVVGGCFAGLIFIIDQFFFPDPIVPLQLFLDPVYTVTSINACFMFFVRNSIIYNLIFYYQGPYSETPLNAGILLIPYGIAIMVFGFIAGALADKLGMRNMIAVGPIITVAALAALSTMDGSTSKAGVEITIFIAGAGAGTFQSPNMAANMLSVEPSQRGVAGGVGMLVMSFSTMIGIVMTFALILNYVSLDQLYALFLFGGGSDGATTNNVLKALAIDYYVLIACCCMTTILSLCFIPSNVNEALKIRHGIKSPTAATVAASSSASTKPLEGSSKESSSDTDDHDHDEEQGKQGTGNEEPGVELVAVVSHHPTEESHV